MLLLLTPRKGWSPQTAGCVVSPPSSRTSSIGGSCASLCTLTHPSLVQLGRSIPHRLARVLRLGRSPQGSMEA